MFARTRRGFLGGVAAVAAAVALPWRALALTNAGAEALIDKVVADINRVINSGKSESAMIRDFKGIFDRYGDNATIAASALGTDGRRATTAQKAAFSDAFGHYISRKYGKRFREFIGGQIDVRGVRQRQTNDRIWYEVDALVRLRGKAPFNVTFRVWDMNGRDQFFNIIIEGVNLLVAERQEIGAMLDRRHGDIDAMIADLRKAG